MTDKRATTYTAEEIEVMASRLRNHPIAITDAHAIDDARDMLESMAAQQRDVDERAQPSTNAIVQEKQS